jgi:hypothetical protein
MLLKYDIDSMSEVVSPKGFGEEMTPLIIGETYFQ